MNSVRAHLGTLARGYAAIFFAESPYTGLLVLLATAWVPGVGASGLAAGVLGVLLPPWLNLPWATSPVYACNAVLSGLFLAGFAGPSLVLVPSLVLAALLAVGLTAILGHLLWRVDHLPALSLPFILGTWALMSVAQAGMPEASPLGGFGIAFPLAVEGFLRTLGSVVCTPHPMPGLLVFAGLLAGSRLLALLALGGFLAGRALDGLLGTASSWSSFNHVLVALALGGVFIVPSAGSLAAAAAGLALVSLGTALASLWLGPSGLPVLALPFVGATAAILSTLRRRVSLQAPHLTLDHPALPEVNLERARLARARGVDAESVPLSAPFYGAWQVYQGFDGAHTHREAWRFALDFFIQEGGRSYRGPGASLHDYLCFGLPVCAPAAGVVAACQDDLPDNSPGHVDARNNWGNHLLIRLPSGLFVLLAHLKQGSLKVKVGDEVVAGDPVAACGSSGRSPQPHLHLHVQAGLRLGSPTWPFHLVGVMVRAPQSLAWEFLLKARPGQGWTLQPAAGGPGLGRAFLLPAQRVLAYTVQGPGHAATELRHLQVEQDLSGVFRIRSDRGAVAAFERTDAVFGTYDRQGKADPFFDLWLLAVGFTPLAPLEADWRDAPSVRLLPAAFGRRVLAALGFADLAGLSSRYRRRRGARGDLRQVGLHRHPIPGLLPVARTLAFLHPEKGVVRLRSQVGNRRWSANLVSASMAEGTPGMPDSSHF